MSITNQPKTPKPLAITITVLAVTKMYQRLIFGDPASCYELAEETGFHVATIARHVQHMRHLKMIRIAEWYQPGEGTRWTARYEMNVEGLADAIRPTMQTNEARYLKAKAKRAALRISQKGLML